MALHLGCLAPDFEQNSSIGPLRFHNFLGKNWGVFVIHSERLAPFFVGELEQAALIRWAFDALDAKLLALSTDDTNAYHQYRNERTVTKRPNLNFPLVADVDRKVTSLYGLCPSWQQERLPTASVLVLDPSKRVRAILTYPATIRSSFREVLRIVGSLQATERGDVGVDNVVALRPQRKLLPEEALK